jgi:hypothetical protein
MDFKITIKKIASQEEVTQNWGFVKLILKKFFPVKTPYI